MVLGSAAPHTGVNPVVLVTSVCSNGVTLPVLSLRVIGGVPWIWIVGSFVSAPTPYSPVCSCHVAVWVSSVTMSSASVASGSSA